MVGGDIDPANVRLGKRRLVRKRQHTSRFVHGRDTECIEVADCEAAREAQKPLPEVSEFDTLARHVLVKLGEFDVRFDAVRTTETAEAEEVRSS